MKTDRELLELAAKAIGLEIRWESVHRCHWIELGQGIPVDVWNPLEFEGDSIRLLMKLKELYGPLLLAIFDDRVECGDESKCHASVPIVDGDISSAVRHAITTHAAEIQLAKERA